MLKFSSAITILFLSISILKATIINVPSDQPTIQAGIDSANHSDTVLVYPGSYAENINFNGKRIILASLFLITGDTTYIENSIIDGKLSGSVIQFISAEDSNSILQGFTLINGNGTTFSGVKSGGGIFCYNSNPTLQNLIIRDNSAIVGGGIFMFQSNSKILNSTIKNNSSIYSGGGIFFQNSNLEMINSVIMDNSTIWNGGGVASENSHSSFKLVKISQNITENKIGGGIYSAHSHLKISNSIIINNSSLSTGSGGVGGGMYSTYSHVYLYDVKFTKNHAAEEGGAIFSNIDSSFILRQVSVYDNNADIRGGGIFFRETDPFFDSINLCSIYMNFANFGNDLYASSTFIHASLDTFTVLLPSGYNARPITRFNFDTIRYSIHTRGFKSLFVSETGDNYNDGLSTKYALKSISFAKSLILANGPNPQSIYLLPGVYSKSITGDYFEMTWQNHISLKGSGEHNTIVDAENSYGVFYIYNNSNIKFSDFTIRNGNRTQGEGGGIDCVFSSLHLKNITINNCISDAGGGISIFQSDCRLENVTFHNNHVADNTWGGGGLFCYESTSDLINVTFSNNISYQGGAIYLQFSHLNLINCLLWNNTQNEVFMAGQDNTCSITAAYNDIAGGQAGITNGIYNTIHWLSGNIDVDPLFINPGNYNYNLQENSPCIDAGTSFFSWNSDTLVALDSTQFHGISPDLGSKESPFVTLINESENSINDFRVSQNYPNPFNPSTTIKYTIPRSEKVKIEVFNLLGQKIMTLLDKHMSAGNHEVKFSADNLSGGVYWYRIQAGQYRKVQKMILIK